ncbi:unnamed protein product [Arabis nemorensis]|uniref:F-box domain-containing protein n=1 Tax=Arabis nemorensis TaxID=586526 RepID=A0A565BP10_9BRAS|nr:unnamed protein product [Arabis nemorensis]
MNPLPQDCIVEILPLTSAVSMIFKSAADADNVWNQFLPSDRPDGFVAPEGLRTMKSFLFTIWYIVFSLTLLILQSNCDFDISHRSDEREKFGGDREVS